MEQQKKVKLKLAPQELIERLTGETPLPVVDTIDIGSDDIVDGTYNGQDDIEIEVTFKE